MAGLPSSMAAGIPRSEPAGEEGKPRELEPWRRLPSRGRCDSRSSSSWESQPPLKGLGEQTVLWRRVERLWSWDSSFHTSSCSRQPGGSRLCLCPT